MKDKITFTVTQRHIDAAMAFAEQRRNGDYTTNICHSCPVALALKEEFGFLVEVVNDAVYKGKGGPKLAHFPRELIAFIMAFDNEEPVEPQTFTVELI